MKTVATKAVVIPNPKPLLDRSNVHHRPRDKAARVSESCTLLSKLSFCVTRLLRQSLKLERCQFMIKYLLDKWCKYRRYSALPSCHGTEGSRTDLLDLWKDTTLAWLMPTNTATHLMTLAHSLLNLCGSPKWLSRQGYRRPTTAEREEQRWRVKISYLNYSDFRWQTHRLWMIAKNKTIVVYL